VFSKVAADRFSPEDAERLSALRFLPRLTDLCLKRAFRAVA
jgi:hypothetical protein